MLSDLSGLKANCLKCGPAKMSLRCFFSDTNDQPAVTGEEERKEKCKGQGVSEISMER